MNSGLSQPAVSSPSASIAGLNGTRAVAVLLVFFAHSGLEHIVPGGLGVTVFFVLSGYLITTLMRREFSVSGDIRLRAFYLRRIVRLMPPLFIVVAAAVVLSSIGAVDGQFSLHGLLSVLFYLGNYFVIANDFTGIPAGIGVVWSLAVEEHFYLLFPPLAILLLRQGRRRIAATVLATLCLAIFVWRCWLVQHGATEAYLTMATDTRADAILIGCATALITDLRPGATTVTHPRRDWAIGLACLSLLLLTLIYRNDTFRQTARYTLQSLAIAPLIVLAVRHSSQPIFRWLNSRPLVYLGTVSYTIYLSHQLILNTVMHQWPQLSWAVAITLTAVLTLLVAEAMRRWIEEPCAALRRQLHRHARPEIHAETITAVVAR